MNFNRSWKRILAERNESIARLNEQNNGEDLEENNNDTSNQSDTQSNAVVPLSDQLKSWAIQNRVSMRGLNGLLAVLRAAGHTELPLNYRTIMQTPRNVELISFQRAKYWYRGLTQCLRIAFVNLDRNLTVRITFNIDGLPIFEGSQLQFWPILALINGLYTYTSSTIVMFLHCK